MSLYYADFLMLCNSYNQISWQWSPLTKLFLDLIKNLMLFIISGERGRYRRFRRNKEIIGAVIATSLFTVTRAHAIMCFNKCFMCGSRGGTGGPDTPTPLKNHKNIGFLSNIDQDPM